MKTDKELMREFVEIDGYLINKKYIVSMKLEKTKIGMDYFYEIVVNKPNYADGMWFSDLTTLNVKEIPKALKQRAESVNKCSCVIKNGGALQGSRLQLSDVVVCDYCIEKSNSKEEANSLDELEDEFEEKKTLLEYADNKLNFFDYISPKEIIRTISDYLEEK